MSKYLPKEDLMYFSPLNKEEVLARLADMVEPEKLVRVRLFGLFRSSGKLYEGIITGDSFEMIRIIGYQNSFLPKISGTVESTPGGSLIHVKMKLNLFVMIFMIVWMSLAGIAALVCTLIVVLMLVKTAKFEPLLLIPLGMFAFGYLLTMSAFKGESRQTKRDLEEFLQATFNA